MAELRRSSTCLAIAVNAWFWAWVPNHTLAASRVMLAMSWDRLLPRWFSRLHPRNGTPVRAVAVFSALAVIVVIAYSGLGVWRLVLHGTLVSLISFAVTCLAAALFPYLHREQYRASTASPYEFLRVPLLSVAGAAFCAFAVFLVSLYVEYGGPSGELRLWDSLAFVCPTLLADGDPLPRVSKLRSKSRRRRHRGLLPGAAVAPVPDRAVNDDHSVGASEGPPRWR